MSVTKRQIQQGLVQYMDNEVVKAISDKPVMMAAAVISAMLKNSDAAVDRVIESPVMSILLGRNDDGTFDIDPLFAAIQDTVNTYGKFELKIPLLKDPFRFSAEDFRALKSYIEGGM